jgi:hypothetical protein
MLKRTKDGNLNRFERQSDNSCRSGQAPRTLRLITLLFSSPPGACASYVRVISSLDAFTVQRVRFDAVLCVTR